MKQGQQIVEDSFRAFDEWLFGQPEDVREMDILEQVDLYYAATTQVGAA